MQKNLRVITGFSPAINKDFYNTFQPVVPHLFRIGVVAQLVSAITEGITIALIVQSNLTGQSKAVAIAASIIAVILLVYLLEVGGRRFTQVLTRCLVWKKLTNVWYVALFTFVLFVTGVMFALSLNLSTKGVKFAFNQSTLIKQGYDATNERSDLTTQLNTISSQFDKERLVLEKSFLESKDATTTLYDAKIREHQSKVSAFEAKDKKGEKWAKSHAQKWEKKVQAENTTKSKELATITANYTATLKDWQKRSNEATQAANDQHTTTIEAATKLHNENQATATSTANFWGSIFSNLVGFSIVLAFVCIVVVEVFNRGSEMEITHEVEEKQPYLIALFFAGIYKRINNLIRKPLLKFAQVAIQAPHPTHKKIGFNVTNDAKDMNNTGIANVSKVSNLSSNNDGKVFTANYPFSTEDNHTGNALRMTQQGDALRTG